MSEENKIVIQLIRHMSGTGGTTHLVKLLRRYADKGYCLFMTHDNSLEHILDAFRAESAIGPNHDPCFYRGPLMNIDKFIAVVDNPSYQYVFIDDVEDLVVFFEQHLLISELRKLKGIKKVFITTHSKSLFSDADDVIDTDSFNLKLES